MPRKIRVGCSKLTWRPPYRTSRICKHWPGPLKEAGSLRLASGHSHWLKTSLCLAAPHPALPGPHHWHSHDIPGGTLDGISNSSICVDMPPSCVVLSVCEAWTVYRPGSAGSEGFLGLHKTSGNLGLQLGLSGGLCRGKGLKAQRFAASE